MCDDILVQSIEKKEFKKGVNKLSRILLYYTVTMFAGAILYVLVGMVKVIVEHREEINNGATYLDDYISNIDNNGVASIIGVTIGMIVIFAYRKKKLFTYDLAMSRNKMDYKKFFMLFVCFMAPQILFSVVGVIIERTLNQWGYSILGDIEAASSTSTTISMALYVSFIGPIAEEIVFRGVVLRQLESYGKLFAIIASAILFGVFHGNLVQGIFAGFAGIVLGYVAMEYSIKWAIFMHIMNNFLFGDVMGTLLKNISETTADRITDTVMGLFFGAACIVLFRSRGSIKQYIRQNKTERRLYAYLFTSIWMIIYLFGNLMIAISGIEKIT